MNLEIITPEKNLYQGEVKLIQLPGSKGSFEILNNHAPIVSTMSKGTIKVVENSGNKLLFDVAGGVIECSGNKITVLAEV